MKSREECGKCGCKHTYCIQVVPPNEDSHTAGTSSNRTAVELINILAEIKAQKSDQINALRSKQPDMHGAWERVIATIDSGANAPVMPPTIGSAYSVTESEGSKAGNAYQAANGGIIPNLGEKLMPVVTKEGAVKGYMSQCADVTTVLQSVNHLNRTGHGVWLDGNNSFMMHKETGELSSIDHDGKDFTMEMWVIPPSELAAYLADNPANEDFAGPQGH